MKKYIIFFCEVIWTLYNKEFDDEEKLNREIEIEKQAIIAEDIEYGKPKKLQRELRAEALRLIEESARTQEDFKEVAKWYDRLDANRERKERYHEISRGDNIPLDYNADENGICFPRNINKYFWKQIQRGEFDEIIYDCPHELQELIAVPYISKIIGDLTAEQKEVLFYHIVKGYSTSRIACIRGQTDRNIRKVKNTALKQIRKRIYNYLTSNSEHNMTTQEKTFVENYQNLIDNSE